MKIDNLRSQPFKEGSKSHPDTAPKIDPPVARLKSIKLRIGNGAVELCSDKKLEICELLLQTPSFLIISSREAETKYEAVTLQIIIVKNNCIFS